MTKNNHHQNDLNNQTDQSKTPESLIQSELNESKTESTITSIENSQPITEDGQRTPSLPYAQNSEDIPPQNNENQSKNKRFIALSVVILIILFGLIALGLWKSYQPKTIDVQGRVDAETIYVSTKLPSRIESILVHDGQKVNKGQLLVTLSSPEVEAKKQQALGALQSALALQSTTDRGSQQENINSLYANWQSLKAQQNLANTTFRRGETLYQQGVISRQRRDEMLAASLSAQQMTEAAYQQYARAQRGSTPQQKSSADAQVDIAKAAVAEANALESETKLFSPINGTVSKTYGQSSELVAIGVPIVSILQDEEKWVSLNVREDQYAQVYQVKTLEGYIPALNQTVSFNIKNIDAEGDFATIKTTRQTGGYDIRSFKVKLTPAQPLTELKVGMSVIFKLKESQ